MRTHELKLDEQFFDAVLSGEKPFEVRKNDRGFQKGDKILFTEYKNGAYCWRMATCEITYVLNGWGIEPGYCVFGIAKVEEATKEEPQ